MDLRECYKKMQGDYEDVLERLPSEASVAKFLRKFLLDENYQKLQKAISQNDVATVFATTHNLKGMCANLSITALAKSSSRLCEAVRGGTVKEPLMPLMEQVTSDYEMTVQAIQGLDA